MSFGKWRPSCLGLNMLKENCVTSRWIRDRPNWHLPSQETSDRKIAISHISFTDMFTEPLYQVCRCFPLWYIPVYMVTLMHMMTALQWLHNGHDSISNHQPHNSLLNCLFRRRSKKTSKLRVTGLWAGNSLVPGEFPAQMASYSENDSIWWRHHVLSKL